MEFFFNLNQDYFDFKIVMDKFLFELNKKNEKKNKKNDRFFFAQCAKRHVLLLEKLWTDLRVADVLHFSWQSSNFLIHFWQPLIDDKTKAQKGMSILHCQTWIIMRESQSSRTRTLLRLAIISTPRSDDTLLFLHRQFCQTMFQYGKLTFFANCNKFWSSLHNFSCLFATYSYEPPFWYKVASFA